MPDRRVVVEVKVKLIVDIDEGVSMDHVINNMDYNFIHDDHVSAIIDTEILDYDIIDSK